MSVCQEPQAHPDRCGCALREPHAGVPIMAGVSVIANDLLPPQTMVVSRDIFEKLKREVQPA